MKAEKWNYDFRKYDPYELPPGSVLIADLGDPITCAACGRKVMYGNTLTSLEIHNSIGMGYAVCPECNKKEWKRREAYEGS